MSIFAIGDLHLSFDERIAKPMDIFGDKWIDHHERVKENWLQLVGEDDTVIIPGDVSWGLRLDEALADLQWIHQLPGKKVITKGNHDLWWTSINKLNNMAGIVIVALPAGIITAGYMNELNKHLDDDIE